MSLLGKVEKHINIVDDRAKGALSAGRRHAAEAEQNWVRLQQWLPGPSDSPLVK